MNLADLNKVAAGHDRARQGHPRRRRVHRHHQEAVRRHQHRMHRGQPARLSRDDVPLGRGHEAHLGRDPLRRDHLAEGQGRHAAGRDHQEGGLDPRHQGRRGNQAAAELPGRAHHHRPRQARRPAAEILRAGCALREMARGDRHRRGHPDRDRHPHQHACAGALRRALPGRADRADRRARGADGRRSRHRPLLRGHHRGAQGAVRGALPPARRARRHRAQAEHGDLRQEERQARRRRRGRREDRQDAEELRAGRGAGHRVPLRRPVRRRGDRASRHDEQDRQPAVEPHLLLRPRAASTRRRRRGRASRRTSPPRSARSRIARR